MRVKLQHLGHKTQLSLFMGRKHGTLILCSSAHYKRLHLVITQCWKVTLSETNLDKCQEKNVEIINKGLRDVDNSSIT